MNVRQRILINAEDEITYNPTLVQGIFLRTLETSLKKDVADLKWVWGKSPTQGNTQGPNRQYSGVRPRDVKPVKLKEKVIYVIIVIDVVGVTTLREIALSIETRVNHLRERGRGYH